MIDIAQVHAIEVDKRQHTLSKLQGCYVQHKEYQEAFPGPVQTLAENNSSMNITMATTMNKSYLKLNRVLTSIRILVH